MAKHRIPILSLLLWLSFSALAETPGKMSYRGFVGGMMVHSGYVRSRDVAYTVPGVGEVSQAVRAVPVGLGGAIKLQFGEHFRLGGEGYVSNVTYGDYRSHASVGWGGALAEYFLAFEKVRLFAGGILGGGSERNMAILSENTTDFIANEVISHRKYGFMAVDPYIGAEFPLTQKINLVLKVDYLINATNPQADYFTGPRMFVGILFGHANP